MVKVMKKENAIIRATDEMAIELQLQGYVEVPASKSDSDEIAKQPVPYTKEEVKVMKEVVEDNQDVIVTEEEAKADAKAKEVKKAK